MIILALILGSAAGLFMAKKVKMTSMPEMVALFNGFGGIASALVASAEYFNSTGGSSPEISSVTFITLILSVLIGTVTFSGSLIAFLKLSEYIPGQAFFCNSIKTH